MILFTTLTDSDSNGGGCETILRLCINYILIKKEVLCFKYVLNNPKITVIIYRRLRGRSCLLTYVPIVCNLPEVLYACFFFF